MAIAGLIEGPQFHYLDHLAPLCALEGIPLVLTDRTLFRLARAFYPKLSALYFTPQEAPEQLVNRFEVMIVSTPRVLFDQAFYLAQALSGKWIQTIWCPHGSSDKGQTVPFMEALAQEALILTYGVKMERFIRDKGVRSPFYRIGNYRLAYYQQHRAFYDALLPPKKGKTLLYAPTWQDAEKLSSFPHVWRELLTPPRGAELLIKLHPHLYCQYPEIISELKARCTLIEDFPPIYPLLFRTDLLLGDHSSINDDFLVLKRPICRWRPGALTLFGAGELPQQRKGEIFDRYQPLLSQGRAPL